MRTPVYHEAIVATCDCKHLTVDEVFLVLKEIYPKIGYSTVYRNVEELVVLGKLRKIQGIWPKALFEKVNNDHFVHFVDVDTGEILDVSLSKSALESLLPGNFSLESADLRIYGKKK